MPTHDVVPSMFMYDFANLCAYTALTLGANNLAEMAVNMNHGTYIHCMRQDLLDDAIRNKATHMLWVDTDMRFPKDALLRLLKHNVDIVGINYSNRRVPCDFVAIKTEEPATKCWTTEKSTGLETVQYIGFGLVLMRMSVMNNLAPPPWFQNIYDPKLNDWCGEDAFFCRLLGDAGIDVYIDHDLSKDCGHMGMFKYECGHAEVTQQAILKDEAEANGNYDICTVTDGDSDELVEPE